MTTKIFDILKIQATARLWFAAIVISVLPILSSCSRSHDEMSVQQVEDLKIKMDCSVGTKAVVNNKEGLISQMRADGGKGFGIVGFKMVQDLNDPEQVETTRLFDNFEVKPVDDQGDNWVYSPVRYWDKRSYVSYQFVGYWPKLGNQANSDASKSDPYVEITDNNKTLTIRNIPNWQRVNGTEIDFLTTTREGRYADFNADKVNLTFSHLLSKFTIKAYYIGPLVDDDNHPDYGVRIKKITLKSPGENDKNVLDGVINTDNSTPASTDFKRSTTDLLATQVTKQEDENANTIDMVNSYVLLKEEYIKIGYKDELDDENNVNFVPTTVAQWLMVPHVWRDVQFEIDFEVKTSAGTQAKTQESAPVTIGAEHDDYATLPGHSYAVTLYFDVSNSGLKVETVAVENWTVHDVSREFYNW